MSYTQPSARTVEARRLYGECGWGYKRIARELGIDRDYARQLVRPDRMRRLQRRRKWRRNTPQRRARQHRRAILVLMWHDGASLKEIAARLGTTPGNLGVMMAQLRRQDYDLPYRPRPYRGAFGRS